MVEVFPLDHEDETAIAPLVADNPTPFERWVNGFVDPLFRQVILDSDFLLSGF